MQFIHPFALTVCGMSGSGKTIFVLKFIKKAEIVPPPEKVLFCYGEYQKIFDNYKRDITFKQGLPDVKQFDGKQRTLLIIDDMMTESNEDVSNIFTKYSHHRNISVIFLTQNLFYKSRHSRTMSLNTHYMVIFKNPRDKLQIATLARQMFPNNSKYLVDAYEQATREPYQYLVIDLKPETDDRFRVRSNIFPGEIPYVYIPITAHELKLNVKTYKK
jgi:hypothetical protein